MERFNYEKKKKENDESAYFLNKSCIIYQNENYVCKARPFQIFKTYK